MRILAGGLRQPLSVRGALQQSRTLTACRVSETTTVRSNPSTITYSADDAVCDAKARCAKQERQASRSTIHDEEQQRIDLKPPRGTRDFYPDEMRLRKWLFGEFTAVSELFGFEQYDSPVLESEPLFVRKAGEEIRDQLFNFVDKGDRPVALRPELTPSLSRMFLARSGGLALPVKWYNIGQCWRYERMTRGRRREHYQWNMDIIGVPGVAAEAELLAAITTLFAVCIYHPLTALHYPTRFVHILPSHHSIHYYVTDVSALVHLVGFACVGPHWLWHVLHVQYEHALKEFLVVQRLGLTHEDIKIRVNNRKVLQTVAQQCNIPDASFSAVCVILDKLDKIPEDQARLADIIVLFKSYLCCLPPEHQSCPMQWSCLHLLTSHQCVHWLVVHEKVRQFGLVSLLTA